MGCRAAPPSIDWVKSIEQDGNDARFGGRYPFKQRIVAKMQRLFTA